MACLTTQMSISPRQYDLSGKKQRAPRAVRCSASLDNGAAGAHFTPQFLQLDDSLQPRQVFRDESKGIVCYKAPTGEVTCEGIDEGPHFQPAMENQKGILLSQLFEAKSADEPLVNGAGI